MTRKEEIGVAAVEHADKQLQRVDEFDFAVAAIADYDNGFTDGFKQGAQWADAHPQSSKEEFIEKACKWLKENLSEGYDADNYPMVRCYDIDMEDFINEFRREMEE